MSRRRNNRAKKKSAQTLANFVFDENLSWHIPAAMNCNYTLFSSVQQEFTKGVDDLYIWNKLGGTRDPRAIIMSEDEDFLQLAEVFIMHAMMRERTYENLGVYLKAMPFITQVRGFNMGQSQGQNATGEMVSLTDMFKQYAPEIADYALSDAQNTIHMRLAPDGLSHGHSAGLDVLKQYGRNKSIIHLFGKSVANAPQIGNLDTNDINTFIDMDKLNKTRQHVGMHQVTSNDYPLPPA